MDALWRRQRRSEQPARRKQSRSGQRKRLPRYRFQHAAGNRELQPGVGPDRRQSRRLCHPQHRHRRRGRHGARRFPRGRNLRTRPRQPLDIRPRSRRADAHLWRRILSRRPDRARQHDGGRKPRRRARRDGEILRRVCARRTRFHGTLWRVHGHSRRPLGPVRERLARRDRDQRRGDLAQDRRDLQAGAGTDFLRQLVGSVPRAVVQRNLRRRRALPDPESLRPRTHGPVRPAGVRDELFHSESGSRAGGIPDLGGGRRRRLR